MDTMVTGEGASQPEPETVAAAPEPPAGGAPVVGPPPAAGPPKKRNWMLIALIAVSCAALLLLGSTITLAVVGDFGGGQKAGFRFDRQDRLNPGQMETPDGGQLPMPGRRFRQQQNNNDDGQMDSSDEQPSGTGQQSTSPQSLGAPLLYRAS